MYYTIIGLSDSVNSNHNCNSVVDNHDCELHYSYNTVILVTPFIKTNSHLNMYLHVQLYMYNKTHHN